MNMFLQELKSLRKSLLIWACSLIALSALFLFIYPSMVSDAAEFKKLLSGYPEPIRAALGINLDYITSLLGFYSMIFSFITLGGAIQGMNLGVSVLSKEVRERTADFLLVKPVSRTSIITAKLLAAITAIIITDIIFFGVTLLIANSVKTSDYDAKLFFMVNLTLLFLQLIFLALGAVVSVFFKKIKSVLPISLGVVFGLYMIGVFVAAGKDTDAVRYISPFKYFDVIYIIKNASYETSFVATSAVIIVISIVTSYMIYIRKDIHAVS
jgi:ABC-2 type transport system permease protein